MAGTVIADRLEAASTSQLVIENGVALTPPTIVDVNNVQIGTFCRAWVNFNGTGTVAIRSSFNVSSITDGGVGIYTVNFTNAMPDANYSWSGLCGTPTVTNGFHILNTPLAASAAISTLNTASALFDPTYVTVMVMR